MKQITRVNIQSSVYVHLFCKNCKQTICVEVAKTDDGKTMVFNKNGEYYFTIPSSFLDNLDTIAFHEAIDVLYSVYLQGGSQ